MDANVADWLSMLFRWFHIIAGIAWIGTSFHFMSLDYGLRKRPGQPEGVKGDIWLVHGGGFYQMQKYTVAPDELPEHLHWYRWESYLTWISGFGLLVIVYYWGANSFLIDRSVMPLLPSEAILISLLSLGLGWLFYDRLCRSPLSHRPLVVFVILYAAIILASYVFAQVFSARAAYLHVGMVIATMMTGNVFFVIIPNQRKVVADMIAGRPVDPEYGRIAKLRSTHNNYLTLPVVFMMISNHYPAVFGHPMAWVTVGFVLAIGGIVRHFFNTREAGGKGPDIMWQWPTAGALAVIMLLFTAWRPDQQAVLETVTTAEAVTIVNQHCLSCHAAAPTHPAFEEAPGGVMFDDVASIKANGDQILAQSVLSNIMPLGNETEMTDEERARLGAWIRAGMPD